MQAKFTLVSACLIAGLFFSCKEDEIQPVYDPTPYLLPASMAHLLQVPQDNHLTLAKVELGRMLFYEKKLSGDNSQSCADCHQQKDMFSDIRRFSIGVDELPGRRQAMPLFNLGIHPSDMFWDGRSSSLRDQALRPIQDPVEMHETLENVVAKLSATDIYKDQFIRAFGDEVINPERIGLAIEQFEMTLISNSSKYDSYLHGQVQLSPSEERGRVLFFSEFDPFLNQKGGECFHCHGGFNFTNNAFMNNGLDAEQDFTDLGRFEVTHDPADRARFKVPSLRNIAYTAPYMHDGRFATLDEVLDHYNTGVKSSSTVDGILFHNLEPGGLQLTEEDKADLKAFLLTLSDPTLTTDQRYANPFE